MFLSRLTAVRQTPFLQKNCEGEDKHILKSKVADRKLHMKVYVLFFSAFGVWMCFLLRSSSIFLSQHDFLAIPEFYYSQVVPTKKSLVRGCLLVMQ